MIAAKQKSQKLPDVTHATLVKAGRLWLLNHGCRVVATEFRAGGQHEHPDVIGWGAGLTAVIECKISLSDFVADEKKSHSRAKCSLGNRRWYLTPRGLLNIPGLDLGARGCGLLEYRKSEHVKGYYTREVVEAPDRHRSSSALRLEHDMLVSVAWRALEALKLVRPLAIGGDGD